MVALRVLSTCRPSKSFKMDDVLLLISVVFDVGFVHGPEDKRSVIVLLHIIISTHHHESPTV
jgi:hypothetical protein